MLNVKDMSLFGHKRTRRALLGGAITTFLFLYGVMGLQFPSFGINQVQAGTNDNLSGDIFAENIGYISLNCTNDNSCATSEYGVNINLDGTLEGYAWSSAIGWIKFGGLSDFPEDNTGEYEDAVMVSDGGVKKIKGWARACGGTATGDCSTMDSRTDGWDGWISFSCENNDVCGDSNYEVTYTTIFDGYAWGADVVGWIEWNPTCEPGVCDDPILNEEPFDYTLNVGDPVDIYAGNSKTVVLTADMIAGTFGDIVEFSVLSANFEGFTVSYPDPSYCELADNGSCSSSINIDVDPDAVPGPRNFIVQGYSVDSGLVKEVTVSFNVKNDSYVTATCSPNPSSDVKVGDMVTWSVDVLPPGNYAYSWTGTDDLAGTSPSVNKKYDLKGTKEAMVTVSGGSNDVTCEASVLVNTKSDYEEF